MRSRPSWRARWSTSSSRASRRGLSRARRPRPGWPPRASARSRALPASSRPMPTTSSAASGWSPSSSPASSAPRFLAIVGPSGQRQVVRPARRPAARSCRRCAPGQRALAARAAPARRAAARRAAAHARVGREGSARRGPRHAARRTSGSSSPSTSSRSCSPPAAPRTSAPRSPIRSPARPPIRTAAPVVVVAVRADFYGRFAAYPALAELLGANHVLVGPMQASELRRVVELPAGRVGLRVEPELLGRADRRRRGRARRAAAALHCPARALAETCRQDAHPRRLPRVRRRPWRSRPPGRGHLRSHPRRAQAARARVDAAAGRRGRGRRGGAPPRAARRARPGAQRGRGRRARDAGRQPPRHGVGGERRGRPRGAAARMAAPARVDRRGRRRAPASPPHHPGGDRVGRGGARSGRALPRRPPRRRARLDRRSCARPQRARTGIRHREPRGSPSGRRSAPGARTGAFARCSRASRSCSSRPSAVGSSPSSSAARRATPKPPSSPSASARRRSSRRTSASRSCSPARRSRSTTHRRPAATCSPTSSARRPWSGSCPARATPAVLRGIAVSPDGKTLAVGGYGDGLLFFDARTFEQLGKPLPFDARKRSPTARTGRRSRSAGVGYDGSGTFAWSTRTRGSSWHRFALAAEPHGDAPRVHEGRLAARGRGVGA